MTPVAGASESEIHERAELGLRGLVDLATGYQRAQVLFAATALDLFGILATGPKSVDQVAASVGADRRGVKALLDACVALDLLRLTDRGYQNSRTAALFLLRDRPASFRPVVTFWDRFTYKVWARLADAVRTNEPQDSGGPKAGDLFDQLTKDAEQFGVFFDGLAALAYWPARKLAETVDLSTRRHLIDLGGGAGAFSEAIAERYPHLRVTLFDLEPVCALARSRFRRHGHHERLEAVAGDFHRDALPPGADCVLISNVLHDWSRAQCLALLRRVFEALEPGGQVIVHDFMPARGSISREASLFSVALLLDTRGGRVYQVDEISAWIREAGFADISTAPVAGGTGVVTAARMS